MWLQRVLSERCLCIFFWGGGGLLLLNVNQTQIVVEFKFAQCLVPNPVPHGLLQGIVSLCLQFERLLQTHLPQLFYHLRQIGAQP